MARGEQQPDLHQEILRVLMDKIREDPYPSVTVLDMIEQTLGPDDVSAYTEVLLDKVRADQFPSLDHLQRLQRLA